MARTLEELITSVETVTDAEGEHIHINFDENVTPEEKDTIMEFVIWNFKRCEELKKK